MLNVNQISREHSLDFLKRERQEVEHLRTEMGGEVIAKFDRLLIRQLLHEAKEREINEWVGGGALPENFKHRVLINLRSGRQQQAVTARPVGRREFRRHMAQIQRSARLAIQRLEDDVKKAGAEAMQSFWLTHSVLTEVTREQLESLAARSDVVSVTLDKRHFALCLDTSRPLIGADQVENNLNFIGAGVTVALLDTGVDTAHPALVGVVTVQQDLTGEGTGDGNGHGTHTAGIIASQNLTFRGIAPGASIVDIKIMDSTGNTTPAIAVAGIQAAVTAGAQIASNSWGFSHANGAWQDPPGPDQPDDSCVLCTAVNNAVAAGVTFVVAAGNEDNDSCSTYDTHIRCPGLARSAITVAASDDSDNMASFSSIGPTPQGRQKPDVTAPGVQIASCRASGTSMGSPIDANFTNADGTSMACPHVAGVAALMQDRRNNGLTPAQIAATLMTTTVNIGATANEMGAGRVNALAAVNAA